MGNASTWQRFRTHYFSDTGTGFALDVSCMKFAEDFLPGLEPKLQKAYAAMDELEKGGIANPDEKRMVGHYWLRDSARAPTREIRTQIESTLTAIEEFASGVHAGVIAPPQRKQFESLLVVGIGGSALGPQFVNQALSNPTDPLKLYFFDNTDPDGMDTVLRSIPDLGATLVVVISKSGGTKETRNGQLIAKRAFEKARLDAPKHFVAVTQDGSELDQTARREKWLARFPMWDWVGGRTSELSAVGLLPAALQGFDIREMLDGAARMDALTRVHETKKNPAALLAAMWFHAGGGKGTRDMVVLPYKDRLQLFSKYLQQLLMESLGKEKDLDGKVVHQGIAVYGNKGSTDQHAYVQQLRDGLNNFFIVFIEVLKDLTGASGRHPETGATMEVEPEITAGDYITGFYLGTRRALYESGRESVSISVADVSAATVGMLIALFERAVGYYASLINVNAYHQPGVEAGKKAATEVLALQLKALQFLKARTAPASLDELAAALNEQANTETLFKVLEHLAANGRVILKEGRGPFELQYSITR